MGGHHHRGPPAPERLQRREEPLLPVGVQPRRRLVEHEHPRPHGHRPRDGRPFPLPVGQQVRGAVAQPGDVQRRERLVDPRPDLRLRQPQVQRPERHVLRDRRREQLVVRVLHDQLHGGPQPGEPGAVVGHRSALQFHPAGARPQPSAQQPHQRRLPASVAPEEGQGAPLADLEAEAVEHAGAVLVPEGHVPQGDQRRRRGAVLRGRPVLRGRAVLGCSAGPVHDRRPSSTASSTTIAVSSATLAPTKLPDTRVGGTRTRSVPS